MRTMLGQDTEPCIDALGASPLLLLLVMVGIVSFLRYSHEREKIDDDARSRKIAFHE